MAVQGSKAKNQAALDAAANALYLDKNSGITTKTKYVWRITCVKRGIPFVCIEHGTRSPYAYVQFETDTLFEYAFHHDLAYPAQDLTPTEELRQKLDALMSRHPFTGGWSAGGVHMRKILFKQAEEIVHDLLALWDEAKLHPRNAWRTWEEEKHLVMQENEHISNEV